MRHLFGSNPLRQALIDFCELFSIEILLTSLNISYEEVNIVYITSVIVVEVEEY
jgi:hypothetical protein